MIWLLDLMPTDTPNSVTESARDPVAGELRPSQKLEHEYKKLALLQEISVALSSGLQLEKLLALIMEKVMLLMEAERSTLFLMSDDRQELWSRVLQGGEPLDIRLRLGEGIAGWVASSGETVNIPDAYIDERFQPAVDLRSGFRTRSILCVPMRNTLGAIVGVAQVLNKRGGPFTTDDEDLLLALGSQAAIALENSKLYHSVVAKNVELLQAQEQLQQKTHELNLLFQIEQDMNSAYDLDDLLDRIVHRAMSIVGATAGSIALTNAEGDALRFQTTAGPVADRLRHRQLAMGEGVIGWTAAHRQSAVISDPSQDPRHAAAFAESVGAEPRSIICVPLVSGERVLGVLELLDKSGGQGGFTDTDLQLLTLIAGQASKAIQQATSRRERQIEDRLASIGRMLAGIVHDLKTPMTIISGYAQLMAQMDSAEKREMYVEHILHQFDLMSGMTGEVLAFARGETEILTRKVYLNRFFDEVSTQLTHALAGRRIRLEIKTEYCGVAYFDEPKMLRVVNNIARNAADAMKTGGDFVITCRADDNTVYLDFADNGPGIPVELEGRLFDLFATTSEGGTGLGLAIVKRIVEEHGGKISYASERGVGTTFTIALPRRRPDSASEGTSELSPS